MNKVSRIATITWVALIAITCASFLAAEDIPGTGIVATLVVLLGYLKARLIFVNFMEVRPKLMLYRAVFEAWGVLAVAAILVPYWITVL